MPPEKKVWVYDGSIAQYPHSYITTTHGSQGCTTCHGGDDTKATRALAHSGTWQPMPGATACAACHGAIVTASANSLHTTLGGYVKILGDRGYDFTAGSESANRFDEQCTRCHIGNDESQAACGFCHVVVPATAGGGLLNGHNYRKTPDMERNCTACHGSRVKDEFFGLNGDLTERNDLGVSPAQPDVHFSASQELNTDGYAKGCTLCHSGAEMHGSGAPASGSGDRYDVAVAPQCIDCHDTVLASNNLHTAGHLNAMACQVCHSQAYKNCFGCHTDIDVAGTGLPYYKINEGDPTLAVRAEGSAPDALMSFRIGKNPRADKLNPLTAAAYKFAVLRHVPVDKDTFRYSLADPQDGLVPNMAALPTWKYATPHNIQTNSVSSSVFAFFNANNCTNCHGAGYADYWLTDPVGDAQGWVPAAYQADEAAANSSVIQGSAIQFNTNN